MAKSSSKSKPKSSSKPKSGSSAAAALEGYFYQLDVSIWLALDLLINKQISYSVQLEPASAEDLETELDASDTGKLALNVAVSSRRLVVQVKSRGTGPWKYGDLRSLLQHGTNRQSAAARLQNKDVHYLLVTSADLDGVARRLWVAYPGDRPDPSGMPHEIRQILPADAPGRVGVLSNLDREKLDARIRNLLEDLFRVPHARYQECLDALRAEAMSRMRGAAHGVWTRAELQDLIRRFDGYFASSPEIESYVKPNNWQQFWDTLWQNHAVIITGASGTGKTRTADVLLDELRGRVPGLLPVAVVGGPAQIRAHRAPGPVVFSIEDPWGRYRVDPSAEPWNDELAKLLSSASDNRKFIITSRSDVFAESGKKKGLPGRYFVALEAENYGEQELAALFENRVKRVARPLQAVALRFKSEVLSRLTLPLEIQRFFDDLAEGHRADENDAQLVYRCIDEANRDAIERTLMQQVEARGAWMWAALVWGLLKAAPKQSRQLFEAVQAELAKRDLALEDGLEPFVGFLVNSRNLRQAEGGVVTYYHPRVEAGLLGALKAKAGLSARMLNHLLEIFAAIDTGADDWGRRSAANLVQAIRREEGLNVGLPIAVAQRLDAWIADRLLIDGDDFPTDLQLAADVGSAECKPSEVARWLLHVEREPPDWGFGSPWSPNPDSNDWYRFVAADPTTEAICGRFVREILPTNRVSYPRDFADHLARMSPHLGPAFRDAAVEILGFGYLSNAATVAEGAVADLDGFGPVLDNAIEARRDALQQDHADLWLAVANSEYSEDYAEHLSSQVGEDIYGADVLLGAYVERLREQHGWEAVQRHPRVRDLLDAWVSVLPRPRFEGEGVALNDGEIAGLLEAAWGLPEERQVWNKMSRTWCGVCGAKLRERIVLGHENMDIRAEAVSCFATYLAGDAESVARELPPLSDSNRAIELIHDLRELSKSGETQPNAEAIGRSVIEVLPEFAKPVGEAILTSGGETVFRGEALALVRNLDLTGNDGFQLLQARLLAASGDDVSSTLGRILALKPGTFDRRQAAQTGAAELAAERRIWPLIETCLRHPLASVRVVALGSLAARDADGALSPDLLALADDKSSTVRKALVGLLKERPELAHIDTLVKLTGDQWTPTESYGHPADFPIAVAAAEALGVLPELPARILPVLEEIIRRTSDTELRILLLLAITNNGGADGRRIALNMALSFGAPAISEAACEVIAAAQSALEAEDVAKFDRKQVEKRAARVAVSVIHVIARHATDDRIEDMAQFVGGLNARRVLLVPLFLAVRDKRTKELAGRIADLLGKPLADRIVAAAEGGAKLETEAFDGLGDARAVFAVNKRLHELFEDRRTGAAPGS
jgi:hypothetical protein